MSRDKNREREEFREREEWDKSNVFTGEHIPGKQDRPRNGSPTFYKLLEKAAEIHDRKSHDYASNDNPYGNYYFAGELSKLFNNPKDAGFIGRIAEKLYRLANIDNRGLNAINESINDTEEDILTIVALWISCRRDRREVGKYNEMLRNMPYDGYTNKAVLKDIEPPKGY